MGCRLDLAWLCARPVYWRDSESSAIHHLNQYVHAKRNLRQTTAFHNAQFCLVVYDQRCSRFDSEMSVCRDGEVWLTCHQRARWLFTDSRGRHVQSAFIELRIVCGGVLRVSLFVYSSAFLKSGWRHGFANQVHRWGTFPLDLEMLLEGGRCNIERGILSFLSFLMNRSSQKVLLYSTGTHMRSAFIELRIGVHLFGGVLRVSGWRTH